MPAVLGRILSLLAVGRRRITRAIRPQAMREIIEDAWDVVIERAAREARASRKLGIAANRLPPLLQQMLTPLPEVYGQCVQLLLARGCRWVLRKRARDCSQSSAGLVPACKGGQ